MGFACTVCMYSIVCSFRAQVHLTLHIAHLLFQHDFESVRAMLDSFVEDDAGHGHESSVDCSDFKAFGEGSLVFPVREARLNRPMRKASVSATLGRNIIPGSIHIKGCVTEREQGGWEEESVKSRGFRDRESESY